MENIGIVLAFVSIIGAVVYGAFELMSEKPKAV